MSTQQQQRQRIPISATVPGRPPSSKELTQTQLEQLAQWTVIVEDTGDIERIRLHQPRDATTNPSLVYLAAQDPAYKSLVNEAVSFGMKEGRTRDEQVGHAVDMLGCLFGREISQIIPGYISTEVDARLSFDTDASVEKAHKLLSLYTSLGVDTSRILMKLASTWEMIKACEILEKEGIKTNMTLQFALPQAVASAQHGATMVSPFVGRILDWYTQHEGKTSYLANEDPGVKFVKSIFQYFKCHGVTTMVMGASFRNKDEILELAGCDRLTISPRLMDELASCTQPIERKLKVQECMGIPEMKDLDEKTFRWMMNSDPMATEKLAEGIRGFAADIEKLERQLLVEACVNGGYTIHPPSYTIHRP